jgi:hypothetical protein
MARAADHIWALTEHVCGACLGRVLEAAPKDGPRIFRCASCGAKGEGRKGLSHPPICACGSKEGKRDAGIRCVPNDRPRPELPFEYLAREVA